MKKYLLAILLSAEIFSLVAQRPAQKVIEGPTGGKNMNVSGKELPTGNKGSSILDDSTQMLYGPLTTRYLFEKEILFRLDTPRSQDTSHIDFHLTMDPIQKSDYTFHDLGNIGTAMNSVYFNISDQPGARLGVNAFDTYLLDSDHIKYYNTESPYTWFDIIWGGRGRAETRVGYSRNINERWNIGGDFQGYYIDKLIQRARRGDRNVESVGYDLYTWYISKNFKYNLLANFTRTKHNLWEFGGVDVDINEFEALFYTNTAPLILNSAEGTLFRNNLHLLHDYQLTPLLKLFHTMDWGKKSNNIRISPSSESGDYFDIDPFVQYQGEISNGSVFYEFNNQAGIQGFSKHFNYQAGYQIRNYSLRSRLLNADSLGLDVSGYEHSLRGQMGLKLGKVMNLDASGQYILSGQHYLSATLSNEFLEARLTDSKWKPGFAQNSYMGHFDFWVNNFDDPWATELEGKLKFKFKSLRVEPGLELESIRNHIYYAKIAADSNQQSVIPKQYSSPISSMIGKLYLKAGGKKLKFDTHFRYALVNTDAKEVYPLPDFHINSKLWLETEWFNKAIQVQTGIHLHWKSDYYVMGYDPLIQQFYTQQDFKAPNYLLAGLFFNGKIKRGLVFLKMNNLRQLIYATGYVTTPGYPGVPSILDFGFKFNFYD